MAYLKRIRAFTIKYLSFVKVRSGFVEQYAAGKHSTNSRLLRSGKNIWVLLKLGQYNYGGVI